MEELKKCRACGVEKHPTEEYYSFISNNKTYWTGKCKSCVKKGISIDPVIKKNMGRPKNEVIDGKRYCPRCKSYIDISSFYKSCSSYCRECVMKYNREYKKNYKIKNEVLVIDENEILRYIWSIITRGYGVDVIDFFKIIHYHQCLFPSYQENENIPFTTDIKTKWKKLENWYEENKGSRNIHN